MAGIHQYIERGSGRVVTEKLAADRLVRSLYSTVREKAPLLFRMLTSPFASSVLGMARYGMLPGGSRRACAAARSLGVDLDECRDPRSATRSMRALFERQIRFEARRPLPADPRAVVSPADARCGIGSFRRQSGLFLKEKLFSFDELFGEPDRGWRTVFRDGDFAVFRLTPDKYHYNHVPADGEVLDLYEIDGANHSCNPGAVTAFVNAYSKNRRVVTVFDTDRPGGAGVGRVAMVEVTALMIGEVVQRYSDRGYSKPRSVRPGMILKRGQPKSLFRPGSSVDVLIFERGRTRFAADLVRNSRRTDAISRFSEAVGRPFVETDVQVRSLLAWPAGGPGGKGRAPCG